MRGQCLIPGCVRMTAGHFCADHWFALPMSVRKRWWAETDYGKDEPGGELRALVLSIVQGDADADYSG